MTQPVVTTETLETKPALHTTEFWLMLAAQVFFFLDTSHIWTYIPPKYGAIAQTVIAGLYMLSRGWAKSGVGYSRTVTK